MKIEALTPLKAEIEEARIEQRLSRCDLAMKAGYVGQSGYTKFQTCHSCSVKTIQRLADALDLKLVICLMDKED